MSDPRITKLAKVLVNYSMEIQPGEELFIMTSSLAQELTLAVYKEAILAGAHVLTNTRLPGAREFLFKHGNDKQIEFISPVLKHIFEKFSAHLNIDAPENTRELTNVDPARMKLAHQSQAEIFVKIMERISKRELKWCLTVYPTNASAQEADMSLSEYQDFVFGAGLLDLDDPVAAWKEESKRQNNIIRWLDGKDKGVLKGDHIDLGMSIKGRKFLEASGKENFPDGEIYTSPIEESVSGWVRFDYPALYSGREVVDIELWFEDGKIVKESAKKGQDLLTELLNTDEGSRFLGELGIGTNYGIQRFTKNMLFDEKIGGTIHLATGSGFPTAGGKNNSGLHWDMLCNMAQSEIKVDGELFYKDGQFIEELQ